MTLQSRIVEIKNHEHEQFQYVTVLYIKKVWQITNYFIYQIKRTFF